MKKPDDVWEIIKRDALAHIREKYSEPEEFGPWQEEPRDTTPQTVYSATRFNDAPVSYDDRRAWYAYYGYF